MRDEQVVEGVAAFTRALAVRRAESGLSLAQLAGLTGMSAPGINRIENGERTPTLATMIALGRALKMTITIRDGKVEVS